MENSMELMGGVAQARQADLGDEVLRRAIAIQRCCHRESPDTPASAWFASL
jgi:hypothetical protein